MFGSSDEIIILKFSFFEIRLAPLKSRVNLRARVSKLAQEKKALWRCFDKGLRVEKKI